MALVFSPSSFSFSTSKFPDSKPQLNPKQQYCFESELMDISFIHTKQRARQYLESDSEAFAIVRLREASKTRVIGLRQLIACAAKGDSPSSSIDAEDIEVEIEKLSNKRRRIRSKICVEASLQTLWGILTDYENLADFIPGLAVSQVLDKRKNFARLLQIGQQNLPFGLKFNAKGIVDCYEKDFETVPYGQRRDIEFKMIEGDFVLFEGKWSIEQSSESGRTTLSYAVDVEPKLWLPVQLVEGRLCKEIKINLFCLREAAQNNSSD